MGKLIYIILFFCSFIYSQETIKLTEQTSMKAINKLIACEELNFRFLTQSKALATIGMSYDEIKKSKEATDRENEFLKNAIKDVVNEKNMWKENHEDTQKQLEKSRSAWGSLFSTKSVVPFCLGFLSGFVIANSLSK